MEITLPLCPWCAFWFCGTLTSVENDWSRAKWILYMQFTPRSWVGLSHLPLFQGKWSNSGVFWLDLTSSRLQPTRADHVKIECYWKNNIESGGGSGLNQWFSTFLSRVSLKYSWQFVSTPSPPTDLRKHIWSNEYDTTMKKILLYSGDWYC